MGSLIGPSNQIHYSSGAFLPMYVFIVHCLLPGECWLEGRLLPTPLWCRRRLQFLENEIRTFFGPIMYVVIKCLKAHKSLGSLCNVLKTLIVCGNGVSKGDTRSKNTLHCPNYLTPPLCLAVLFTGLSLKGMQCFFYNAYKWGGNRRKRPKHNWKPH